MLLNIKKTYINFSKSKIFNIFSKYNSSKKLLMKKMKINK